MSRALIVEKGKIPKGIAALNSLVMFVDIETGEESHAILSLPSRDNNAGQKISIFSTFGSTLLGCVQGDIVQHETPEGMRKVFIKSIINE
jgi:transcription elongation GreA/GreB family factor